MRIPAPRTCILIAAAILGLAMAPGASAESLTTQGALDCAESCADLKVPGPTSCSTNCFQAWMPGPGPCGVGCLADLQRGA